LHVTTAPLKKNNDWSILENIGPKLVYDVNYLKKGICQLKKIEMVAYFVVHKALRLGGLRDFTL